MAVHRTFSLNWIFLSGFWISGKTAQNGLMTSKNLTENIKTLFIRKSTLFQSNKHRKKFMSQTSFIYIYKNSHFAFPSNTVNVFGFSPFYPITCLTPAVLVPLVDKTVPLEPRLEFESHFGNPKCTETRGIWSYVWISGCKNDIRINWLDTIRIFGETLSSDARRNILYRIYLALFPILYIHPSISH